MSPVSTGKPKWTIYCHTHTESGRKYVGQTRTTWQRRWRSHQRYAESGAAGAPSHIINAIRKYGASAFSCEVLEVCSSLAEANDAEARWISLLCTQDPVKGFNIRSGGLGTFCETWKAETIARRSAAQKAIAAEPAEIARRKARGRAQWQDPEMRARNIAASKAGRESPEYQAKLAERMAKNAIAERARRKAKSLARRKGRHIETAEDFARRSAKMKRLWSEASFREKVTNKIRASRTPEWRAVQSERLKIVMGKPEVRAKFADSRRANREADEARWAAMKLRPCKKCGGPRTPYGPKGAVRCEPCDAEVARVAAQAWRAKRRASGIRAPRVVHALCACGTELTSLYAKRAAMAGRASRCNRCAREAVGRAVGRSNLGRPAHNAGKRQGLPSQP